MADDPRRRISRRDLLKTVGLAGAAAAALPAGQISPAIATTAGTAVQRLEGPGRESLENLSAMEADLLEAMVERLIPSDSTGPGAREARAVRFIDRALGGALSGSREAYASGLEALDRYARATRGRAFRDLSADDRDRVLADIETGVAGGFDGSSASFFNMVLGHTRQGTFGDPYYGGNADFVGWALLGYPGVRVSVSAAEQRTLEEGRLRPNHRSAYDWQSFNRAARSAPQGGDHGD